MADFSLSMEQKLKQEQILSTQMIQKMSLLTLPILDLQQHIKKEMEENPALEINEVDDLDSSQFKKVETKEINGFGEQSVDDFDGSKYEGSYASNSDNDASDRKNQALENTANLSQTLYSYLLDQLLVSKVDKDTYLVAEIILSSLDENGFFTEEPKDLISEDKLHFIEPAINLIQSFIPSGVGVKNYKESLSLQAKQKGASEEEMAIINKMIFDYLKILRPNKSKEIAKKIGISEDDFFVFYNFLKTLNPFPGAPFASGNNSFVVPELSITKNKEGNLELNMNKSNLPKIEISSSFLEIQDATSNLKDQETSKYISESISRAKLLISQVNLRYTTLYNTGLALIETQKDYFLRGEKFLKPLTLKQIAEIVGVHETTISRISKAKWIETDWGIIQMKHLFTQGLTSSTGQENISRNVIKLKISEILKENENKKALSDQKIADKLKNQGIKISRRTVTKYRNELNLDSSYIR